jgi:hypothetical protein
MIFKDISGIDTGRNMVLMRCLLFWIVPQSGLICQPCFETGGRSDLNNDGNNMLSQTVANKQIYIVQQPRREKISTT